MEGRGPTSKARRRGGEVGMGREGLAPKPKSQTLPMAVATIETTAELIDSRQNCSIGAGTQAYIKLCDSAVRCHTQS